MFGHFKRLSWGIFGLSLCTRLAETCQGSLPEWMLISYWILPTSRTTHLVILGIHSRNLCMCPSLHDGFCSSQFTEYVSPWSDRSSRGITGIHVLTGQLTEPTHSMSWPVTLVSDTANSRANQEKKSLSFLYLAALTKMTKSQSN